MNNRQAIKIIKTEKSWESDERIKSAFDNAIHSMMFVQYLMEKHSDIYSKVLDEMAMDR